MPRYPEGFGVEEYDELSEVVVRRGQSGAFSANDILAAYIEHRVASRSGTMEGYNADPVNAGSVAQILDDWVRAGILRSFGGDPPRWELTQQE